MISDDPKRVTIADLKQGVYSSYKDHMRLADKGQRRYHPFNYDFDSTALQLEDPKEQWEENVREIHMQNRERAIARLNERYGAARLDGIVQNLTDLGPKAFSLIAFHNQFYQQAREAYIIGLFYPALVAACALGERILNHLVLDLRDDFKLSKYYKRVYRKNSFDNWNFAIEVLSVWEILVPDVVDHFLELSKIRHRSIHFNPETYGILQEDALASLKLVGNIVSKQFGIFGHQPWFIRGTAGAQFIKKSYETHPFVSQYLIPKSGFIGIYYGMELCENGHWQHLDVDDYGDCDITDEEFSERFSQRDPNKVISREMITAQQLEQQNKN